MIAKSEQSSRLLRFFDGDMRPSVSFATLSHFNELFPAQTVARGDSVRPLAAHPLAFPGCRFEEYGKRCDLNDFLATNRVAGLLIMKDGKVVLENYELGLTPRMRWGSCSIAKSVASTLFGAALKEGFIGSLDDPVTDYVPILAKGVYADINIGQVLTMTSGVRWDETYIDPASERRRLLDEQIKQEPGAILRFMNTVEMVASPGKVFNYNTGESYILGAIIEGATRRSLADYLQEKIWTRVGMEQDSAWWLEAPGGMVLSGSGLFATLRDYARFGQLVLDDGYIDGEPLLPEGWFGAAGVPQLIDGKPTDYGYSWWIPPQSEPMHVGAFQAEGIYGQYIYLHPRERVVIVCLSARAKPSVNNRLEWTDECFFAAVVEALQAL